MTPIKEIEFLMHSNAIEDEDVDALPHSVYAWESIRDNLVITESDILKVHSMLMSTRDTIEPSQKGRWTDVQTSINGRLNPEPYKVPALIANWVKDINLEIKLIGDAGVPEARAHAVKNHHVRFEHIHPFADGNGRVGRIFYNWHRLRIGLPIHIIREEEKGDYHKWFDL